MSLRGLLRGSLFYTLGNFLPRIGAFLLLPLYTLAMAPDEFGVFSLMLALSGLLAIVYRLGLDGALLRLHFDVEPRSRPALYVTLAGITLAAALGLSLVLGLASAPLFDRIFPGVAFVPYGLLALAITATTTFQYVPAALFRATERAGRFLAFAIGAFGLGVVATVVFLLVLRLGAAGALLGQLVSGVGIVIATAWILSRLRRRRFDASLARAGLAFGMPLVPHGLAAWVLNLSDRWLIGLLIGLPVVGAQAAVGIYSFGYLVGQSVALVALSFNAAWIPFFYARGEGSAGPAILREMTTLVVGVLAVLATTVAVFAPELTEVIARGRWGDAALAAADVMPMVAIASLVYGLYYMVVSSIFLRRRTRALPLLTLAAGAANVAANLVLIPRIGIIGAAWATLVGYLVLTAGTLWYARRHYPVHLDWQRLIPVGATVVGAVLVARLVSPGGAGVVTAALTHLALAVVVGVVVALVLREPLRRMRVLAEEPPAPARQPDPDGGAGTMGDPKEHA